LQSFNYHITGFCKEMGEQNMTVCIATVCENNSLVIAASDRMITIEIPPIEFEHGIPKIEEISKTCVALTSGSALKYVDLFREVKEKLTRLTTPSIPEIVEKMTECYIEQRKKKLEEELLKSRGFTLDSFYPNVRNLPPEIGITIDAQIQNYDHDLTILLAGTDEKGPHIYQIINPGTSANFDSIGYGAIGSGWHHAVYCFIANNYINRVPTKEALYITYEAKKHAESAPGVGKATDICIIGEKGIKILSENVIQELEKIYQEKMKLHTSRTETIQNLIDALPI